MFIRRRTQFGPLYGASQTNKGIALCCMESGITPFAASNFGRDLEQWTQHQADQFLGAALGSYCPQTGYVGGGGQ